MKTDYEVGSEIQGFSDLMTDEEIFEAVTAAGGIREFFESLNLSEEAELMLLHVLDLDDRTVH